VRACVYHFIACTALLTYFFLFPVWGELFHFFGSLFLRFGRLRGVYLFFSVRCRRFRLAFWQWDRRFWTGNWETGNREPGNGKWEMGNWELGTGEDITGLYGFGTWDLGLGIWDLGWGGARTPWCFGNRPGTNTATTLRLAGIAAARDTNESVWT
jgi:hypothetical protein